jgi:hypothetical protein
MIKTTFATPAGDDFENLSSENAKEFIFNHGDEFWQVGCAEAGIVFYENDKKQSMIYLSGIEKYGFRVEHTFNNDNESLFSIKIGNHTGNMIEMMNSSGEDAEYYKEYIVPKEVALEAVEYFLKTGERNPNLTWEIAKYPPSWEG